MSYQVLTGVCAVDNATPKVGQKVTVTLTLDNTASTVASRLLGVSPRFSKAGTPGRISKQGQAKGVYQVAQGAGNATVTGAAQAETMTVSSTPATPMGPAITETQDADPRTVRPAYAIVDEYVTITGDANGTLVFTYQVVLFVAMAVDFKATVRTKRADSSAIVNLEATGVTITSSL
jgi:hypothetical protein